MNRCIRTALLGALLAVAANAATLYWDGTGTRWDSSTNWSTDPAATTPDPAAKPGGSDVAVFSQRPGLLFQGT